jgi:NDP-sugar pyrophosphorylase family protein
MTSPERVVVVGASGFGRECLDVLEAMVAAGSAVEVVGVVDDRPSELNLERLTARGARHLGTVDGWLASIRRDERFVLGIGDPQVRRRVVAVLEDAGALPFTAVHPSATLGARTVLGDGVVVCAGATISTNVRLGRHVHVNPNATIGHDARWRSSSRSTLQPWSRGRSGSARGPSSVRPRRSSNSSRWGGAPSSERAQS